MPPRLKVFRAAMGFFESVVAAPSQKAALEAWGTRQDLFKEGMAGVTDDPQAIEAALAHPGVVLQRPAGSNGGFEPTGSASALPEVPSPPKPAKPAKSAGKLATERPQPDRSALTAAEAALAKLDKEQESARDDLASRRAELEQQLKALDAEELDARRGFDTNRRDLQRNLERARKAYQQAGGRP